MGRIYSDLEESIYLALRNGDMNQLRKLLLREMSRGDAEIAEKENTKPLHASDGNMIVNVNVNVFDSDGWTALHRCCISGNLELLKVLIGMGADVTLASRGGWNALHLGKGGRTLQDWKFA